MLESSVDFNEESKDNLTIKSPTNRSISNPINQSTMLNSIDSPMNESIIKNQSKYQINLHSSPQNLTATPPKLPPRNSSTSSNGSNSNKQLINGKFIINNKNDLNTSKSTIENKIAFNFMTKSSCTVNNSITNSNTCTIKQQTTSTFNNCRPAASIMLNGSNFNTNNQNTGFTSSSIITTTTTQCLNNSINNQRKQLNNEQELANNFVRGIFRSCNVNFGPSNFKSQKFITKTTTSKSPAAIQTLNNSLNVTNGSNGLHKITNLNATEIEPLFNRESLTNQNSKLINKAIQQNGFLLKQVKSNQPTKTDHKLTNHHDVTTSNFNYLTNSVSSPSLNSSESDEDDEEEETELARLNNGLNTSSKTSATVKHSQITKSSPNKLNTTNHLLHNTTTSNNNFKTSMQVYPSCPLQRSKTLMLNSSGKPELNRTTNRPKRIEITTTHNANSCPKNRSLVSSPVSTVSTKSVWYEYGCV